MSDGRVVVIGAEEDISGGVYIAVMEEGELEEHIRRESVSKLLSPDAVTVYAATTIHRGQKHGEYS